MSSMGYCSWSQEKVLNMNRREVLAAGIGLGSLALTSGAALACCGADEEKEEKKDAKLARPIYCPMYPYMFCGSYTLYYAVQNNSGVCGANPASMAGPNGLALGCGSADCQPAFKTRLMANAVPVDGNHVVHNKIKTDGIITSPTSVGSIQGVHPSKSILDVKDGAGNHLFFARVYDIKIIKNELDKAELLGMITQADIDKIAPVLNYFPGHESGAPAGGETPVNATVISKEGHTRVVENGVSKQQYVVTMK